MKQIITENIQYALNNVENYKPIMLNTPQEILTKFTEVIIEYMRLIAEKINIKNKQYYIFIFERGIETIIHIFSIIFYYTKNLELTFYHSQKAYYFYIEFIEQISDDNITFLQLSSRDALMFVYKKTIFELNNDRKKFCAPLTSDEHTIVSYTDMQINIYKKLVSFIILNKNFEYENKQNYINMCCDKIQKISSILNKCKIKKNSILKEECIYVFVNLLANKQTELVSINIFFDMLEDFIERLKQKKKSINEKIIINKLYSYNIQELNLLTLLDDIFIE
jgi:hypothetical protein